MIRTGHLVTQVWKAKAFRYISCSIVAETSRSPQEHNNKVAGRSNDRPRGLSGDSSGSGSGPAEALCRRPGRDRPMVCTARFPAALGRSARAQPVDGTAGGRGHGPGVTRRVHAGFLRSSLPVPPAIRWLRDPKLRLLARERKRDRCASGGVRLAGSGWKPRRCLPPGQGILLRCNSARR